jgi:hypothetical protein
MMLSGRSFHRALLGGIAILVILSGCAAPLPSSPDQLHYPELAFQLPEVETLVLANGIQLYLKQDKELPLVQMTAMVGSGAMTTPAEKVGFDDLFGGTWRSGGAGDRTPEELDAYLDYLAADLGASMGAYTAQLDLSLRSENQTHGGAAPERQPGRHLPAPAAGSPLSEPLPRLFADPGKPGGGHATGPGRLPSGLYRAEQPLDRRLW